MLIPRLLLAAVVSLAVVLSAPFVSQIRSWIRATFPNHFVLVVGGLIAAAVGAAILAAVLRIRDRRVFRYGAIVVAMTIAAAYSRVIATADANANAVERFHFVEYGLIAFLFYRAWRPLDDGSIFVMPMLAGLLVGTFEEWLQWFIPVRVGEMRDVFLNLTAIACGLLFSVSVDPPSRLTLSLRRGSLTPVAVFASIVTLTFAAFVHSVHLGQAIVDPAAGTFLSRYTAAELGDLSADRAARWRAEPPAVRRLSREDQYLSEGILHVQERNRRWSAGDAASAWRENVILETYYAPALGTSYPQPGGAPHRWSDVHRAEAEKRAEAAPSAPYVSAADDGFIRTWPAMTVWAVAIGVSIMLVAGARAYDRKRTYTMAAMGR